MMEDKKHKPAFPHQKEDGSPYWGMTLRDYFAIHADWEDVRHYSTGSNGHNMSRVSARYKYADAMMNERDS